MNVTDRSRRIKKGGNIVAGDSIIPQPSKEDALRFFHPFRYVNTIREPGERMQLFGALCGVMLLLGFLLSLIPMKGNPPISLFNDFWDTLEQENSLAIIYGIFPVIVGIAAFVLAAMLKSPARNYAFFAISGLALLLTFIDRTWSMYFWGAPASAFANPLAASAGRAFVISVMFYAVAGTFVFARLRHWYLDNGLFRVLLFVLAAVSIVLFFIPVGRAGDPTKTNNILLFTIFSEFDIVNYLPLILIIPFAAVSILNAYPAHANENITWLNVVMGRLLWMALPVFWLIEKIIAGENVIYSFLGILKGFLLTYGFLFLFVFALTDFLSTRAYHDYVREQTEEEDEEDEEEEE